MAIVVSPKGLVRSWQSGHVGSATVLVRPVEAPQIGLPV